MSDAFVVAYTDIDKPWIRKFAEAHDAEEFLEKQEADVTGFVIEEAEDLEDVSPVVLTTIHNAVSKENVQKADAAVVYPLLNQAVKALRPAKKAAKQKAAATPRERKPRTLKPIDLPLKGGWDAIKKYRKGTRVDVMVQKLTRQKGATLQELADAMTNDTTAVDVSTARSWVKYLHDQHGYGIRSEVDDKGTVRCFLVQPEGDRPADPAPAAKPKAKKAAAKK